MHLKAYVAVTDFEWYRYLSGQPDLDEVNFWQPGGSSRFQALRPGELFLFKLHSPRNFIVGGGFFIKWAKLPTSLAWEAFEERNGASSLEEMRQRVEKYRSKTTSLTEDYEVGCILLGSPFFFENSQWIPIPRDWSPNIVRGKTYDLATELGKTLWEQVSQRIKEFGMESTGVSLAAETRGRYGPPIEVLPRYGQGIFRVLVTDAYQRRCAVTGERTLPTLEAAHIKPFHESGPHRVNNGLLLRSDLHRSHP